MQKAERILQAMRKLTHMSPGEPDARKRAHPVRRATKHMTVMLERRGKEVMKTPVETGAYLNTSSQLKVDSSSGIAGSLAFPYGGVKMAFEAPCPLSFVKYPTRSSVCHTLS